MTPPLLSPIVAVALTPNSPAAFDFTALDARRIRLTPAPEKPKPVLTLCGQTICTAGNLTVVASQAKSGKSAVIGAALASMAAAEDSNHDEPDTLGFQAAPPDGRAVILLDTEQSPYDSWRLVRRASDRVGMQDLPEWIRAYHLVGVNLLDRRAMLKAEMQRAKEIHDGVHAVFIDGIADLCIDPNDPAEAFALVEELHGLAAQYDCPIVVVLHENPSGTETGKTRGHLGSQLERKAESNIRLVKSKADITQIFAGRCRSASIPDGSGVFFKFDTALGRHITVDVDTASDKKDKKRAEFLPQVEAVFDGASPFMKYKDLTARITEVTGLKAAQVGRYVTAWLDLGLVLKGATGTYTRATK